MQIGEASRVTGVSAKMILRASDGTGVQLYSNDADTTVLQDVTLAMHQFELEKVLAVLGAPDFLLNNAALMNEPAPLWKVPAEKFSRLIDVNVTPAPAAVLPPERPEVWPVARHQAASGADQVTNLRHELVNLDRVVRPLLEASRGASNRPRTPVKPL